MDLFYSTEAEKLNRYARWLFRVVCWDGILPLVVTLIPKIISDIFPRNPSVGTFSIVAVVIGAFCIRLKISANDPEWENRYGWQRILFLLNLFFLIFVEALLLVLSLEEEGVRWSDWLEFYRLLGVYLLLMALAQFPVRREGN